MRRREFITLLGSLAAGWPLAVRAQQPEHMRRIGVLMSVEENDPEGKTRLSRFTQGLAETGWTDGHNLRMEVRWGGGDVNRTRTFAKELVALQPDVILAQGTPGTAALQRETRTIPIVFVVVADPVGPGFVAGLQRPGGNITGPAHPIALAGVRLTIRTASTRGMPTTSIKTGSIWLSNVELPAKVVSSPINIPTPSRTSYSMPPMVKGASPRATPRRWWRRKSRTAGRGRCICRRVSSASAAGAGYPKSSRP